MRVSRTKGLTTVMCFFLVSAWLYLVPPKVSCGEEAPFEIRSDGTVVAGTHTFPTMAEYVRSDYFRQAGKRCGTPARRAGRPRTAAARGSAADCSLTSTTIKSEYAPTVTYTIPTVFHVIHKVDGTGNISNQRIYDQVTALNEDFGAIAGTMGGSGFNTRIQFALAGITRTANDSWFADENELGFKTELGWDQDRFLNVYVNSASGYLGYSYLPQDGFHKAYLGVVMLYEAIGGRNNGYDVYDQGRSLVHEIGHHLGLLHTFEGDGCFEGFAAGDLIADTPSESVDHYGCTQTYTCDTPDPIHNYMNYTDDSCMSEFTDEQANRLVCTLVNYLPTSFCAGDASLVVTSPSGGTWPAGSTQVIRWTPRCVEGNVTLDLYRAGAFVGQIGTVVVTAGSMPWTIPVGAVPGSDYRVRASLGMMASLSSSFTIAPAAPPGPAGFSPLTPCRVIDTRSSSYKSAPCLHRRRQVRNPRQHQGDLGQHHGRQLDRQRRAQRHGRTLGLDDYVVAADSTFQGAGQQRDDQSRHRWLGHDRGDQLLARQHALHPGCERLLPLISL
jgi:hypothetical protein